MNIVNRLSNIFSNTPKRAWIVIVFIALLFLTIFLNFSKINSSIMVYSRSKLLTDPEPIPDYISAIAPFPGSEYPTGPFSSVYWAFDDVLPLPIGVVHICVRLDARVIDPLLKDPEDAYNNIPLGSVIAFLNGKNLDSREFARENILGELVGPKMIIEAEGSYIYIPPGVNVSYTDHVPVNFCWGDLALDSGEYLVEVKISSASSGTLKYKWAFTVMGD